MKGGCENADGVNLYSIQLSANIHAVWGGFGQTLNRNKFGEHNSIHWLSFMKCSTFCCITVLLNNVKQIRVLLRTCTC